MLSIEDYEIIFTGAAAFEIYNVTDGTQVMTARISGAVDNDGSFAYTSGDDIEFEGIRLAITDGATGPANGDVFTANTTEDSAKNMTVNSVIAGDVNKIAASEGDAGDDNLNALSIAALRDGNYMNNSTASFSGFYNGLVGEIGVEVASSSRTLSYKQTMVRDELATGRNPCPESV